MINAHNSLGCTSALSPETAFDVVAIASSAGGHAQLFDILAALPQDFRAAILIVQHLSPLYPTELAALLTRNTGRVARLAKDGDSICPGGVFIAPPNRHLVVNSNRLSLSDSAKVCYTRPAADPLFLSVAVSYGTRAIGVVLSGTGQDGAMGIRAIKAMGGTTIAVDPLSCEHKGMTEAAIATDCVDFVLAPRRITRALLALVMVQGATSWSQSPAVMR